MKHIELIGNMVTSVRSAPYPIESPTTIEAPNEVECGWIKNGDEWIAPVVPVVVSFRSLAFALLQAGLYQQVKSAALATPEGEIWWNTAQSTTVHRDHPFVIELGAAIGQTPEQLDAIFASALASQS
jgi:hypothetical protein